MINKYNFPDALKQAFEAVDAENVDTLRRFLTSGGDVNVRNADGLTLLQYAASKHRYISATLLLEGGADPDLKSKGTHGYTALHYAAEHDNYQMVDLLAKYKANPEIQDKNKQTPLHVAAYSGSPKAVYALTKAGADMFAKDRDGYTPLDIATWRKSEVLDFAWQEYIDIERHLTRKMDDAHKASTAFKQANEKKVGNDIATLKKNNPNRYKLGK